MSLTARERRNPPPRKKSCTACIKAKRRCDLATPACLRCAQRQIPCEYPLRQQQQPARARTQLKQSPLPTPMPMSTPLGSLTEISEEGLPDLLIGGSCTPESPFFGSGLDSSLDLDCPAPFIGVLDDGLSELLLPTPEEANQESCTLFHQPSVLSAPLSEDLEQRYVEVIARRLQYSIDEIRKAPTTMVTMNQTPWCHPMLYARGMPRSMQDAHSSCALYMAKNNVNSTVIMRSIESRVTDLLAAPIPTTPEESLAHTQSLLLYQIIRLFDGDISSRASAERTIPALETSAIGLVPYVDLDEKAVQAASDEWIINRDDTGNRLSHLCSPTAFWNSWIFQESARRTLLLTFFFLQAYRILRLQTHNGCDGRLGLCHNLNLSAHLWHARTAADFADCWAQGKHLLVSAADFSRVFEEARADDLDVFGRMLITAMIGIEEADAWLVSKGGSLKKAPVCAVY